MAYEPMTNYIAFMYVRQQINLKAITIHNIASTELKYVVIM